MEEIKNVNVTVEDKVFFKESTRENVAYTVFSLPYKGAILELRLSKKSKVLWDYLKTQGK